MVAFYICHVICYKIQPSFFPLLFQNFYFKWVRVMILSTKNIAHAHFVLCMYFHASLNPNLFSFPSIFFVTETLSFTCVCLYVCISIIHPPPPPPTSHLVFFFFFLSSYFTYFIHLWSLNWTEQKDPLNTFCIETSQLPPHPKPNKIQYSSSSFFQYSSISTELIRETDRFAYTILHRWASTLLTTLIV